MNTKKIANISYDNAIYRLFEQEGYKLDRIELNNLIMGLTWFERYALELCNNPENSFTHQQAKKHHDAFKKVLENMQKENKLPKFTITYDPRGFTFKVFFPSEIYNTWGGKETGFGIPSKEHWQDEKRNFFCYLK